MTLFESSFNLINMYLRKHASLLIVMGLMLVVVGAGMVSNGTLLTGEFQVEQTPPYPDLIVSDLEKGSDSLFITIENTGTLDMEAMDYAPYLYLYLDGKREWIYTYPMYSDISFIMAGTSYIFELENVEGGHTVKACIDPTDAIKEQDEYNNCYEEPLN